MEAFPAVFGFFDNIEPEKEYGKKKLTVLTGDFLLPTGVLIDKVVLKRVKIFKVIFQASPVSSSFFRCHGDSFR